MEHIEFVRRFSHASADIDMSDIMSTIILSINALKNDTKICNTDRQMIVAMEELSELQQAISKNLRGKGDRFNTIEEIADVLISIMYLQYILSIPTCSIYKAMNVKIDRLRDELEKIGAYK